MSNTNELHQIIKHLPLDVHSDLVGNWTEVSNCKHKEDRHG